MICPVCRAGSAVHLTRADQRDYWRCTDCQATFLQPDQRPSRTEERAHYEHHQNFPDDPRYRHFLSKLSAPLLESLAPGSDGLDYGCGPGPALAAMMREAGHAVALYDPFFHPDRSVLCRRYDFIACTESCLVGREIFIGFRDHDSIIQKPDARSDATGESARGEDEQHDQRGAKQ